MNIDEQRLQQFFTELKAKREAFAENYKYFAPQLAPQFNCFDFIDSDENKLSEIIAHLLNPQGTHAQGDLFLKLFFEEMEIKYPNCNQKVTSECEDRTRSIENDKRRIDILVDFGKDCFGLAIENKPWAGDQNEQLSDYSEHLEKVYQGKYCLIYLSGDDSDPSEKSISKEKRNQLEENKQYKKMKFSDIVSWLEQCEKESKSDHVKYFLRDFIAYCQKTFLGATNMAGEDDVVKGFISKEENFELAQTIGKQLIRFKEEQRDKFLEALETKDLQMMSGFKRKKIDGYSGWKEIHFCKQQWEHYAFYFGCNLNNFVYGIRILNKKGSLDGILNATDLNTKLTEKGKREGDYAFWGCWYEYKEKFWLDTNEMVKFVTQKIEALIKVAEVSIDQAEGLTQTPKATTNEPEKQP
jgi:hypothetical protein